MNRDRDGAMDHLEINRLEQNIKRATEIIRQLSHENQRLKAENEILLHQIKKNELTIQQLKNQQLDSIPIEQQSYSGTEREGQIKQKIQRILEKLDTFQQLTTNR